MVDQKQKSYIAKAPIRRLMKNEGAKLVSSEAVDFLIEDLKKEATKVVKKAVKLVKEDKRKRIQRIDIIEAINTQ